MGGKQGEVQGEGSFPYFTILACVVLSGWKKKHFKGIAKYFYLDVNLDNIGLINVMSSPTFRQASGIIHTTCNVYGIDKL